MNEEDQVPVEETTLSEAASQEAVAPPALAAAAPAAALINPLHVKLAVYDGPLDLLLDLIKKNEMDIYDIPVAEVTRQYLDYLATMKQLDLEVAGEFIVMAATLIYIKSKMLLPHEGEIEDEDGLDPRAELVRKLLEYQAFKQAAKELGILEDERGMTFTRQISDYYLSDLDPGDLEFEALDANLFDLLSAFQNVLARATRERIHEVFEQIVTIEEKIVEIKSLLAENKRLCFSKIFRAVWSRNELIATFLAVLELVRTRFVRVAQEKEFDEIIIERREESDNHGSPQ